MPQRAKNRGEPHEAYLPEGVSPNRRLQHVYETIRFRTF